MSLDVVLAEVPPMLADRWRARPPRSVRRVAEAISARDDAGLSPTERAAVARAVSHHVGPWSALVPGVAGRVGAPIDRLPWS